MREAGLTFVGTSYPLQRGDVVVVLANREGENTDLPGDKGSGAIIFTQPGRTSE